jgi:site-specific recombinase XerD
VLSVIGKGNKERKVYLTPAAKSSISSWLDIRRTLMPKTDLLFILRNNTGMTVRSLQAVVKKYVRIAGFDESKISAHSLRNQT